MSVVRPASLQRSCFLCVHHVVDTCTVLDEVIDSEVHAARDCELFERGDA